MRNPVRPSSCVTPAGTSNELDVQNVWEEIIHTHTHIFFLKADRPGGSVGNLLAVGNLLETF